MVPGQGVSRRPRRNLPADYDVALYGDIQAAFDRLVNGDDLTQLAASVRGAPGSRRPSPRVPRRASEIPTTADPPIRPAVRARGCTPRGSTRRGSTRRGSTRRGSTRRGSTRRGSTRPTPTSRRRLRRPRGDAFSAAQNQTLLAVSANTGTADETVSAATGNTDGSFYVRVQGHDDTVFDADAAFRLGRTVAGGTPPASASRLPEDPVAPHHRGDASTVIVTDTNAGLAAGTPARTDYLASLGQLAAATDGAVVDVAGSQQVRHLQTRSPARGCPYAVNLVAGAIKDIVDYYRNANSKYVVIAGGDEVIPFFRYPDLSGLGQESQFEPPVLPNTPSGASLSRTRCRARTPTAPTSR